LPNPCTSSRKPPREKAIPLHSDSLIWKNEVGRFGFSGDSAAEKLPDRVLSTTRTEEANVTETFSTLRSEKHLVTPETLPSLHDFSQTKKGKNQSL
jgi:hypothetical protein